MCNIIDADEGIPEIYNETYPKAKKQHVCCECGSTIDPGETYQRIEGVWNGDFETYKTCMFCSKLRPRAEVELDLAYLERIALGGLWECVGMDFAAETE